MIRCISGYWLVAAFLLLPFAPLRGQSVGLVLSGGGAKGLSHVGVIKALEENNIPIDYICGTSMGAIVGGLYAIGYTPDEMVEIFKSSAFESWFKGRPEQNYTNCFYKDDPSPKMFTFSFGSKLVQRKDMEGEERRVKVDLPTSLISPFPMDLAVIQIFAPASEAAGEDFNNLMVPFFCMASDISEKRAVMLNRGNLSAAVRASMTYPLYFKPVIIDSTLLFDGGFYDNFPWRTMKHEYNPDYIIGAKCVTGDMRLDEDDLYTQLSNMLMVQTDYEISSDNGLVIERKYPFGLMEFNKVDDIVQMGYENALRYVDSIKMRVKREVAPEQRKEMRSGFREKWKPLKFSSGISFNEGVPEGQKEFILKNMRTEGDELEFGQLKRGYYQVAATNLLRTFYPSYTSCGDSLPVLNLKVAAASPWRVSIGGNISSSSLNQGYLGVSYSRLARNPWKVGANMNVGKYYKGGKLGFRHNIGVMPLTYYSAEFTTHQFDYYNGNQNLFASDKMPGNIQRLEYYSRATVATMLSVRRNLILKGSFVAGGEHYKYYQTDEYVSDDIPDRTFITLLSPMVGIERNTVDYSMYPTSGHRGEIYLRYDYAMESFRSGTTSPDLESYDFKRHRRVVGRFNYESYIRASRWFSLGVMADVTLSQENRLGDYIATMMYMPAFRPLPHNSTIMMENYRAASYIGAGLSPVFKFLPSLYIHTNVSYFCPYRQIYRVGKGDYAFSGKFPGGAVIANMAFVWQSPLGPVSFAATYYQNGEYKWYPQFNIGFLIFNRKAHEF